MTARRTTCRWCSTPLTRQQRWRKRTYCSRSCAKEQYHAQHPGQARAWLAKRHQTNRKKFIARLAKALHDCGSLAEAYRRGYQAGYSAGSTRRRRLERTAA